MLKFWQKRNEEKNVNISVCIWVKTLDWNIGVSNLKFLGVIYTGDAKDISAPLLPITFWKSIVS